MQSRTARLLGFLVVGFLSAPSHAEMPIFAPLDSRAPMSEVHRVDANSTFAPAFDGRFGSDDDKDDGAEAAAIPETRREVVEIAEGRYQITIDTTEAPDLTQWVRDELVEVVRQWYPKIVELLPSDGYEPPRSVEIAFRAQMGGVASASGARVQCSANWMRENLQGEAKGAIVHELVHVVQQYRRVRRGAVDAVPPPGWLVEGVADYIRWFLYEPESRGAEITPRNVARARYDASYRVSANFLNWVMTNRDDQIVAKLNAAMREGRYREELWKEYTGHSVQELDAMWREWLREQVDK